MEFKQSNRYQHQHHKPETDKQAPTTRFVPLSRCISIAEKYMLFPIGSVLCFNHMKNENKMKMNHLALMQQKMNLIMKYQNL